MDLNTHSNQESTKDNEKNDNKNDIWKALLIQYKLEDKLNTLERNYERKINEVKTIMYDFYSHTQKIEQLKAESKRIGKSPHIFTPLKKTNDIQASPKKNSRATSIDQKMQRTLFTGSKAGKLTRPNFYLPKVTIDIEGTHSPKKYTRNLSRHNTETLDPSGKRKLLGKSLQHGPYKMSKVAKGFKFEPKKRNLSLTQLTNISAIDDIDINLSKINMSPIKKSFSIVYRNFLSSSKYESIHRRILLYLGDNPKESPNNLKNMTHSLRRAYLLNKIDQIKTKLLLESSDDSTKTDNDKVDLMMEKEVLIHNEKVLGNYLKEYKIK